jgi:pimeloyl-ACP methyl ester carboxylesterase
VPYAITQGSLGDLKPLIALGAATSEWSAETMALGSMLAIVCAEDLARALRGDQAKNTFGFMGDSYVRVFAAGCSVWPYREVPTEMTQAFSSRVPALAISGEADPVTPPASGEATLKMFATRVHAIVPHGFHTNSSNRCVADIIGSFLADPERGGRDHACLKRAPRPRFLVSPTM